ncbi:MAG: dihydrofolate reductase family protein [Eubacterium sp.]
MKRKVILYIAMSLDGFIADKYGGVEWLDNFNIKEIMEAYNAFVKTVDTVIMGKTTYTQLVEDLFPGEWPYEDMESYVLTHEKKVDEDKITFVDTEAVPLVESLRENEGKNIWVLGGAAVVNELLLGDAIDEFQIAVIPVLLGSGTRLFENEQDEKALKLTGSIVIEGVVNLVYTRINNPQQP